MYAKTFERGRIFQEHGMQHVKDYRWPRPVLRFRDVIQTSEILVSPGENPEF